MCLGEIRILSDRRFVGLDCPFDVAGPLFRHREEVVRRWELELEPDGPRASALNRALVLNRDLLLSPIAAQTDPYGRVLAHPTVCDIDVEAALLAAGLARKWRD